MSNISRSVSVQQFKQSIKCLFWLQKSLPHYGVDLAFINPFKSVVEKKSTNYFTDLALSMKEMIATHKVYSKKTLLGNKLGFRTTCNNTQEIQSW